MQSDDALKRSSRSIGFTRVNGDRDERACGAALVLSFVVVSHPRRVFGNISVSNMDSETSKIKMRSRFP